MVEGEEGMTIGRTGKTVLIIMAAAACFLLIKYIIVSDETRIKRVIYKGTAAIEEEDFEGAMTHVSREYQDDYGLNKLAIGAVLKRLYKEFDAIDIRIEHIAVEITEGGVGRATILTWATARVGDDFGYLVGSAETPRRVVFTLVKERARWRVVKTEGVEPQEELWL
jgi:hypothetical protein